MSKKLGLAWRVARCRRGKCSNNAYIELMAEIYVDESIHERGGLIVLAAVYSDEPLQERVELALRDCGFDPARDEFKSSMRMHGNIAAQKLRDSIQSILRDCKIAIAVCSSDDRKRLTDHAVRLLAEIDVNTSVDIPVYFDEGMHRPTGPTPPGFEFNLKCDSRTVAGIQVADAAAHVVATAILSDLGMFNRTTPAATVYPDDEGEIELAWVLWMSLRYALATNDPVGGYDENGECEPYMRPFGVLVAPSCSPQVREAVHTRFGGIWLGCIH